MHSSILAICMLLFCCAISTAQKVEIRQVPIRQTSWASGQQMYREYCVACHGENAKGDGPAASACTFRPRDLTKLASENGGNFPYNHFYAVMKFGTQLSTPAHGSADMPIWLPLLSSLNRDREGLVVQRIHNLGQYVASLQAK